MQVASWVDVSEPDAPDAWNPAIVQCLACGRAFNPETM